MSQYRSNLRDIQFNLFEVFNSQDRMGAGPFADMDPETANAILKEVARLAEGPIGDSWASTDRTPPVYDPTACTVTVPQAFKDSYQAWMDAEWWRLDIPNELGGAGATPMLRWAAAEMVLGANPAIYMYACGPGFASILWALGNDTQKRIAELAIENQWGSTMVLTEPDAGSDVGAGRTKATPLPDGSWRIDGVKRFITSGEHDMADNILHLVLARPEGAAAGTKGLSLFLVPKFHFDPATGELGERNGVYATNVEHKMGLKASATCEMSFSQTDTPAIGWLVGDVHDGIAQMFKVIEYARMMVGTKAMSAASTGYLNALDYAKTREQGPDITRLLDKTAPRVTIINHPQVRQSLMMQKSYAEGLRALTMFAAYQQDLVALGHAGDENVDLRTAEGLNDLLLPLVKGYGAQRANEMLNWSLQIFGGSGFLQDYPLEGLVRDAVIDELYEGTIQIQSMDFFFRKIVKDQFRSIMALANQVGATAASGDGFTMERAALAKALEDVQAMMQEIAMWAMAAQANPGEMYRVGVNLVRLLMAAGDLVVGWLLLRQAEVASAALAAGAADLDKGFYEGKIAAAAWFAENRLPLLSAERIAVESTTGSLMDVPEAAF